MERSETMHPNIRGIQAHARRKAQAARQQVDYAIDHLIREAGLINFNTIAKQAGVTKSYLYAHRDIRERIEALRQQQTGVLEQKRRREADVGRTEKTKDILLAAKDRRIRELEEQNRQLREELKVVYGKLYEHV